METIQKQRELLQQELKKSTQKTLSAEERAQQMDQMLLDEEASVKQLEKELSILRERQFKHAQELFELKRQDTTMQAEIQGGRASVRNLRSKIHKLDEEALKQQEILYTQDFKLQQLQHKLNRMDGERTVDEKAALNSRISVSQVLKWEENLEYPVLAKFGHFKPLLFHYLACVNELTLPPMRLVLCNYVHLIVGVRE